MQVKVEIGPMKPCRKMLVTAINERMRVVKRWQSSRGVMSYQLLLVGVKFYLEKTWKTVTSLKVFLTLGLDGISKGGPTGADTGTPSKTIIDFSFRK